MGVRIALAVLVAATGCSTNGGASTPTTQPTVAFSTSGCPVADDAFCATAADAANALAAGNAGAVVALSREDTVDCSEVAREYFPQCQRDDVLDGYGLSDADLVVDIVPQEAYAEQLEAITSRLEPSFTDEIGDGAVRVVGIGTCGPDVPDRRTYHLAWTAAQRDGDDVAQRVLGSFEFTFTSEWRIALTYVDLLERWEAEQTDPLEEAFCAAGRSPWE